MTPDDFLGSKVKVKLSGYGIKDTLYFWIQAFLSNRFQKVKLGSSYSKLCHVSSGVPQGSVLGPLLFNLFINDITDHLAPNTTAKLFADDLKLYSEFSNVNQNHLQAQLNAIQNWSEIWQLKISYSKCNILSLGSKDIDPKFCLGDNCIAQSDNVRDLGVTIDSDLKFKFHINNITTTANQRSALILRCFLSRNPDNLVRAFKVYVRPLVEYASTTWSPSYIAQILQIERVQRTFTKRVPGCHHLPYHERLVKLRLQSLEHRRLIADLVMCFNIVHNLNCLNITDFFNLNSNKSLRGHSLKIVVPIAKTNSRKFFIASRIVPIWNSLPNDLVTVSTPASFKRLIKNFDLSRFLTLPTFYS